MIRNVGPELIKWWEGRRTVLIASHKLKPNAIHIFSGNYVSCDVWWDTGFPQQSLSSIQSGAGYVAKVLCEWMATNNYILINEYILRYIKLQGIKCETH